MTLPAEAMTPAQRTGWVLCIDLAGDFADWAIAGGQMVWLHVIAAGAVPLRATEDIDVVVDLRAAPRGLRFIDQWLIRRGLELQPPNSFGQSHRYIRHSDDGDVEVSVDLLAPDHIGGRADLTTTPPARTIQVPGGSMMLNNHIEVAVTLDGQTAVVRVPRLTAALAGKAEATRIGGRRTDRDWPDAALLLSLISDPIAAADDLSPSERRRMPLLVDLADTAHPAWRAPHPTRGSSARTHWGSSSTLRRRRAEPTPHLAPEPLRRGGSSGTPGALRATEVDPLDCASAAASARDACGCWDLRGARSALT